MSNEPYREIHGEREHYADGAKDEREAIVEWLRGLSEDDRAGHELRLLAERISDGEHNCMCDSDRPGHSCQACIAKGRT